LIVRKFSKRDDKNQSEVIDIPAAPPFLRVLVLLSLGGSLTRRGCNSWEDTDGLVIILAIEIEEGDFEEIKEYILNGSAVSESVSERWMTSLRCTSVVELFLSFSKVFPISE